MEDEPLCQIEFLEGFSSVGSSILRGTVMQHLLPVALVVITYKLSINAIVIPNTTHNHYNVPIQ
jgi:hypothetical protein